MYKTQIIYGSTYGDIEAWVSSQPERVRQTRVKDRMEAVLKNEPVEKIENKGSRPNKYMYQLYITNDHPYLHDFMEFLEQRGHKYAPQLRWLLLGQIVPNDYVPFKWKENSGQNAPVHSAQASTPSAPSTPVQSAPAQPVVAGDNNKQVESVSTQPNEGAVVSTAEHQPEPQAQVADHTPIQEPQNSSPVVEERPIQPVASQENQNQAVKSNLGNRPVNNNKPKSNPGGGRLNPIAAAQQRKQAGK